MFQNDEISCLIFVSTKPRTFQDINHVCCFKFSFQASLLPVLPRYFVWNGVVIQKLDGNNLRSLVSWVSPLWALYIQYCSRDFFFLS
jgi:hypothetical protein